MNARIVFASLALVTALCTSRAQSPAPVVVQAVPTANVAAPAQAAPAAPSAGVQAALQAVQGLKAANDEILKKQAATLLQLEEIEKAAEQIKIYSKRG